MDLKNKFDRLAQNGMLISICYGPSQNMGIMWSVDVLTQVWSVDVLTQEGRCFNRPFYANDLEHCLDIAIQECTERGWLKEVS